MEMVSSAVLADLVSRSISFLFARYEDKQQRKTAATVQEELQRLRHLLLRSGAIVEEADRRLVTNRTMLRQLKALRDETFRGYYVLDVVRCRAAPRGGDGRKDDDEDDDEVSLSRRRAFSMSRFNPAKRSRSGDHPEIRARAAGLRLQELQQTVQSLEAVISDTKEFVVFLASYPLLYRQPYGAYMFMDKCMFGRYRERERIMEFLLQMEPPGAAKLGVLPIVGPAHIGKSTLVEHVCHDETVRNHFSLILYYNNSQNGHKVEGMANLKDKCLIKHQNDKASGEKRLIVIELLEDMDEETWNIMHSSEIAHHGSRIIVTSRSEKIVRFGTVHALRLECLPTEAYWYFFKICAFGSDDPGQHPKLASLALEMANLMQGSFMFTTIGAVLLRDNFNTQSWSRILTRIRDYMQMNVLMGKSHDDINAQDDPRFTWSIIKQKPDKYFILYDIYQRNSKEEVPQIQYVDLQAGCDQPQGKYEILFWKSRIPPYFNYICKCEIRDM